jgi:hypothetical protein
MLGLLRGLLGGHADRPLVIEGYWCESSVKLREKVRTPLGSTISVATVCVDISYSLKDGSPVVHRAILSRSGGRLGDGSINVAAERTGEAWYASAVCSESLLLEVVEKDLAMRGSRLRKLMLAAWPEANAGTNTTSLVDALNSGATANEIARIIADGARGTEIVFGYSKPGCPLENRHVLVQGVSGESLRAEDHKDSKTKNFRLDRISNVRLAKRT